jgi:hypothetical protein
MGSIPKSARIDYEQAARLYHTWLHWKMTQKQREETNNGKSVGIDNTKPYQRRLDG